MNNFSTLLLRPQWRLRYRTIAIVMVLLIVTTGNIPGARADIAEVASGAVLHSIAYALLAALWFLGSPGSAATRAWKAVLAVAVMGACDETIQSFFPYRGASVGDWAVDVGAALAASALLCLFVPRAVLAPES